VNDEAEALIPAGPFLMGRSQGDLFAADEERPARIVTLSAFAIDRYPVTNRRYREFVLAGGYRNSDWWCRDGWIWLQQSGVDQPPSLVRADLAADDQPVSGLCWYEAKAFCRWAGRRLPTSAEWERAARGLDGRIYPWGDAPLPDSRTCNFDGNVGRPTPVDRYPLGKSPCGLFDMAGNVNNWVEDVYWPGFGAWCLKNGRLHDPVLDDPLAEELHVPTGRRTDRGGGFLTGFSCFEVLATTRPLGWEPDSREPWHGFRTARSLANDPASG
jgi:formylglycine-generating enzyme required for sulfatase activity